jgi:hypothetical protein
VDHGEHRTEPLVMSTFHVSSFDGTRKPLFLNSWREIMTGEAGRDGKFLD